MSRKVMLLVLVAMLSMFAVQNATIPSVNARSTEVVTDPNTNRPHTYVYKESPRRQDGTCLWYYDEQQGYMQGELAINADYKKDFYVVSWSGMNLID